VCAFNRTYGNVADVPDAQSALLAPEGVDEGQVGAAGGTEHHPLVDRRGSTKRGSLYKPLVLLVFWILFN